MRFHVLIGMRKKRWKGSLSLEAAICMPPLLCLLIFGLSVLYLHAAELELRWALDQSAHECSFFLSLAEKSAGGIGSKAREYIEKKLPESDREIWKELEGEVAASLSLAPILERRIDQQLRYKRAAGGLPLPPHERKIICIPDIRHRVISVEMDLRFPVFPDYMEKQIRAIIPLWSDSFLLEEKNEDAENDQIWEADNFTRGRYFRQKEGSNLPDAYPVISRFVQGEAAAVKSVDLTAPTYRDPLAVEQKIEGMIANLAAFNGYHPKSGSYPEIDAGNIVSRKLILIIPENSPDYYDDHFFMRLKGKAGMQGVQLEVKPYAESRRYGKPGSDGVS